MSVIPDVQPPEDVGAAGETEILEVDARVVVFVRVVHAPHVGETGQGSSIEPSPRLALSLHADPHERVGVGVRGTCGRDGGRVRGRMNGRSTERERGYEEFDIPPLPPVRTFLLVSCRVCASAEGMIWFQSFLKIVAWMLVDGSVMLGRDTPGQLVDLAGARSGGPKEEAVSEWRRGSK